MAYKVGIVGATGAVGQELIRLFHERNFPGELVPLASSRSAGKTLTWGDKSWTIQETKPEVFKELDVAIFSAGGSISQELAPQAAAAGCVVIDNSSAFRMDPSVPLVVPEINGEAALQNNGIIANPNCSTAIALMGLYPLHKRFGLKRFFASTYQAVSGAGAAAMQELEDQVHDWVNKKELRVEQFPHQIAFNVIPHVDKFFDDGYTREEHKMLNESRKILGLENLRASTTCVRVPVLRAHSMAISAEFEQPVSVEEARAAIDAFEGAEVMDDTSAYAYPMPIEYSGKVRCGVGRIRKDAAFENGLSIWICGDQLWKGAALNAIQIAEYLHQNSALTR